MPVNLAGTYETYQGSPVSKGLLQFDLWNVQPSSGLCDWDGLKAKIRVHGLRNSLLVSPMPTASTSQILGEFLDHARNGVGIHTML